jgi:hypothetical protein
LLFRGFTAFLFVLLSACATVKEADHALLTGETADEYLKLYYIAADGELLLSFENISSFDMVNLSFLLSQFTAFKSVDIHSNLPLLKKGSKHSEVYTLQGDFTGKFELSYFFKPSAITDGEINFLNATINFEIR